MFTFDTQNEVGKVGETLVRKYYESQTNREGKAIFICRPAKYDEQMKGADLFVINNELGYKYIEVKTDTQSHQTGNVALEFQICHHDGKLSIGCQLKTFADYMFYWQHPTNTIYYWKPEDLIPFIVNWLMEDKHKIVHADNKKFFSRSLLIPVGELLDTGVVKTIEVEEGIVNNVLQTAS